MEDELARELRQAGYALIETHISRVFLRGADVFKTKRSVDLGFLDFTTSEARARACAAEIALNRRLAPDVYLDVVALTRAPSGELVFGPPAPSTEVLEWAVHMRRLDDDARADVRLTRDLFGGDDVARIARLLARFHREARSDAVTAHFGEPALIAQNVEENFRQVMGTIGHYLADDEVAELARYQRAFLAEQRPLFEARARAGFVRDGHGDLRLEHLYRQGDGDYIAIDCIEFNERFRFADVCADLAFLTMDLAYHGRVDLAEQLTADYAEESCDYGLYRLLDFYESYRAFVRAKVASILAADAHVEEATRARAGAEARRYYLLAIAAGKRALVPGRLIVTFGLIASGKSTLSRAIGARLGVPVLSADRTRKELLGVLPTEPHHDRAFEGAYAPALTARVYATLYARAEAVLCSGRSVVIDASFRGRRERDEVRAVAERLGVEAVFLECSCPRELISVRLAARATGPSVSDGRAEIFDAFAASYEVPDELAGDVLVRLDTSRPLDETLAAALARLV